MGYLVYPYPKLANPSGAENIVDPEEVNANFEASARLFNGGIGTENFGPGTIGATALANPRAVCGLVFDFNTTTSPWPANGRLCKIPTGLVLNVLSISVVEATSNFSATLKRDAVVIATVQDARSSPRRNFTLTNIGASLSAGEELRFDVVAGSCETLTIWCSSVHVTF